MVWKSLKAALPVFLRLWWGAGRGFWEGRMNARVLCLLSVRFYSPCMAKDLIKQTTLHTPVVSHRWRFNHSAAVRCGFSFLVRAGYFLSLLQGSASVTFLGRPTPLHKNNVCLTEAGVATSGGRILVAIIFYLWWPRRPCRFDCVFKVALEWSVLLRVCGGGSYVGLL